MTISSRIMHPLDESDGTTLRQGAAQPQEDWLFLPRYLSAAVHRPMED